MKGHHVSNIDPSVGVDDAPPPIPTPPSFEGPLDLNGHLTAINQYIAWLADAVLNKVPEEQYDVRAAVIANVEIGIVKKNLEDAVELHVKEPLDDFHGYFGQYLQDSQQENAKVDTLTPYGKRLIYKRTTSSYRADDPIAFGAFIRNNPEMLSLTQLRPAKEAVDAYIAQHNGERPPGVSSFSETKAHIKSA